MNLTNLNDTELLSQTKILVQNERRLLTKILHHLREVERRKLFSDLKYQSLFEYAVKELKYSEGQAGRRIQAMRLIKEIPQIEQKIESGALSLSNVSQAQSYFREVKKAAPEKKLEVIDKLKILEGLEQKSAREAQKILIQMQPSLAHTTERSRALTNDHTEVRLVFTTELKSRLQELRSLLGPQGTHMNMSDLISYMASVSIQDLKIRKFGKKRVSESSNPQQAGVDGDLPLTSSTPTSEHENRKFLRQLSKSQRYQIWVRDQGRCVNCGSQTHLNIDHIKPLSLGGGSEPSNLRLLCFNCNQRQAIKGFGLIHMERQIGV